MTIRHLQIFKTVCDCKSITAAAERLNITQPSVSIAIKELEAFYHTKVFDRINRKIYLTEEGNTLLQYADSLLGQYDESISVLRSGKAFTKCRLGVNVSVAETFLSRIVSVINKTISDITLKVYIHNNEQIDRLLTDNQIDFAIYDKVVDRQTKTGRLLFHDNIAACCSIDQYHKEKISLEDLSKMPLLLREKGSGMRSRIDAEFLKHGYTQNVAAESTSTLGLMELAETGLGYALVPERLAEKLCSTYKIKILSVSGGHLRKDYYLTYNCNKFLNPTLEAVIKVLDTLHGGEEAD
ncbi:MAG: LysR family transcriptional regulator [Lachnospiraceae bacterium]|nr:LysR family transcriptional regulator [Lachnospiraceae bacterium]